MKAGTIAAALLLAVTAPAVADDAFPARPISLVVPIAAGGGLDAVARLTARKLSAALGQPIVIENRAGGSQNIGIRAVAKARPTATHCSAEHHHHQSVGVRQSRARRHTDLASDRQGRSHCRG